MLKKAGNHGDHSKFSLSLSPNNIVPIMHSARKGTASIIGAKKLSCRFNNCSFSSKEGASLCLKF
jgi:hypothetical protein